MSILETIVGQALEGKYLIEQRLGKGGMGAVYLATHLGTCRPVAIKVIAPQFMSSPEFVERFRREAEAAGRLRHPNIVNVTDFGFATVQDQQIAYLVMEYLDGCSLASVLEQEGKLPLTWIVDIVEQICSAIEEAHKHGVIHRDLKPENIWLEPDRRGNYNVKVLDFGLAKLKSTQDTTDKDSTLQPVLNVVSSTVESDSIVTLVQEPIATNKTDNRQTVYEDEKETNILINSAIRSSSSSSKITHAGSIMGTPLYMSPEQCAGKEVDARTDIYSIGVITYQMLTGTTPFTGTSFTVIFKHMSDPVPDLKKLRPDIPKLAAETVMKALEKDPAKRLPSAEIFATTFAARTETALTLVRKAVAICNDNYLLFIKTSLTAWLPAMGTTTLLSLATGLGEFGVFGKNLVLVLVILFFILHMIATAYVGGVTAMLFVSMVVQLMLYPFREPKIKAAYLALKGRLLSFILTASILYTASGLMGAFFGGLAAVFGFLLLVKSWLGSILCFIGAVFFGLLIVYTWAYILVSPSIVLIERKSVFKTIKRSYKLVNNLPIPARKISILSITIITTILILQKPITAYINESLINLNLISVKHIGFLVEASSSILFMFVFALTSPFFSVLASLLYIKARQAEGESLEDIVSDQQILLKPNQSGKALKSEISEFIRSRS
ncbi:MAG: protein kinase [Blastocatellia bacterium]|nr:protein kinase [Blastocatellia bacterium]